MKTFLHSRKRFAVTAAMYVVVALLPVVPVLSAPVVRYPSYSPSFVSIQRLFLSPTFVGMSYHATWATMPVLIGLAVAAFIGGRRLSRLVVRPA